MIKGFKIPNVIFKVREGDTSLSKEFCAIGGKWVNKTTDDYFKNKRVIIFSLPGAFTPTCSNQQLPGFDSMFEQFDEKGIEEIYCLSVNDTFVMNSWFEAQDVQRVYPLPDGNGEFTQAMGASVEKGNVGFGIRSWRYAMVINDGVIEQMFTEEGQDDNINSDPYEISTPENVLENL